MQTDKIPTKDIAVNTESLDLSVTSHNLDFFEMVPTRLQDDDSGVFQVKSGFSPPDSECRMNRFLNDVSALHQSTETSALIQYKLDESLKTLEVERK